MFFSAIKTIKTASNVKTLTKARRIITETIEEYEIDHIAILLATSVQQRRSFANKVQAEIETMLKKKNISYSKHDPKQVRQTVCEKEVPNKPNTVLILAARYPELRRYSESLELWQKRYSDKLFNAVAVGLVSTRERAKKK